MTRLNLLREYFNASKMCQMFTSDGGTDPAPSFSKMKFEKNQYTMYSVELRQVKGDLVFRVHYSKRISSAFVEFLSTLSEVHGTGQYYTDFTDASRENAIRIMNEVADYLASGQAKPTVVKSKEMDNIELPDVNCTEDTVMGSVFTWKEILAIYEDDGDDNLLKAALSKPGVYLQRSTDGTARYVGSAYGEEGILGRWMKHLSTGGNAKHLKLWILENGYKDVVFTVLEFCTTKEQALAKESMWKAILGTQSVAYNGTQLNAN